MAVHVLTATDIILTILAIWLPILVWRRFTKVQARKPLVNRTVAIVVLGDIGRSPRMMYHAESFAKAGFDTTIVGYKGTTPPPSLLTAPSIHFSYLTPPPKLPRKLFVLLAPIKVFIQVLSLLAALLFGRVPPEFILVQNPPSIPTLAIVQLAAWLRGSRLIIDWHNLGYSILALKLGDKHLLVKIAKWFEMTFGRRAYLHLFVTKAMKDHLSQSWRLRGQLVVLHDRPPSRFHRTSATEAHDLFLRLPPFLPPLADFEPTCVYPDSTLRTELKHGLPQDVDLFPSSTSLFPVFRADRPALVISSTSWTADEDFSILLDALRVYEQKARAPESKLPKLLMVVTGKGPLKNYYMQRVSKLEREEEWKWVRCRSLWVEAADYPLLLGSADLGVSLHSSSSALDLPMKVVDMFGCGLPVCALDFACLDELVKDGENGLVFQDAVGLAEQFQRLLSGFPESSAELEKLRTYFTKTSSSSTGWSTWEENWDQTIRPLVESYVDVG